MIVYVHVDCKANMEEVAKDVRTHGPQIVIFTCENDQDAKSINEVLTKPSPEEETDTRGGGGRGEKQFVSVNVGTLIIAGRLGFASTVELRHTASVSRGGTIAIAEVTLNVAVCGQLLYRVAAVDLAPDLVSGDSPDTSEVQPSEWEELRDKLKYYLVRFVAGEFGGLVSLFLRSLCGKMEANVVACSRYHVDGEPAEYVGESFMFALGPIAIKTIINDINEVAASTPFPRVLLLSALGLEDGVFGPITRTRGSGDLDWTSEWAVIPLVKQKATSPLPRFKIN